MNFGNSAYGIGQRRHVNNASSFAPIRGGSGTQPMGHGRPDGYNNSGGGSSSSYGIKNNSGSGSGSNYGNNNGGQRFTSNDSKFGSMQSNNYGRNTDFSGYSQQRFGNTNRGVENLNAPLGKNNYNDNFRGQQQQSQSQTQTSFMGRSMEQRFDNNRPSMNNFDYSAGQRGGGGGSGGGGGFGSGGGNIDNYRGPSQQEQQQSQLTNNLNLARSASNLGMNNESNQRFNNNERNDTFRRPDSFNDNFRGQESMNFEFNNGPDTFGHANNSSNFGYNNNNNNNNRGFFGGQQTNNLNNYENKNNQQQYSNNTYNNKHNTNQLDGFNGQNYRGPNNDVANAGQTLAVINDTVNALMTNQSMNNWQVGNSNYNFGQPNFNNRNNVNNRNFNNANPNIAQMGEGKWGNRPQQLANQGKNFRSSNNNNRPQQQQQQQAPLAGNAKFQGNNRNQNQNQNQSTANKSINNSKNINSVAPRTKPEQVNNKPINQNNNNNSKQQSTASQSVTKNVMRGQKQQQTKSATLPIPKTNVAAQKTQAKSTTNVNPKPEIKKEIVNATGNPKVGQKRAAPAASVAPLTRADNKRRKLALKRGFIIGGVKLPYVNNNKIALPQLEDKSYAVMFFEQSLIYSTGGDELDDEAYTDVSGTDSEADGKNVGRLLVKRIRKRLHNEWTQIEESKKYKLWPTWWTDYKWCEKAIQQELQTFGSVNLRDCFLPDLPRLTTEQVVDVIVKQAQFGLEKNSDNYFNNMKSFLTLMNVTFLENLQMPNREKVQDMIRAVPNEFWVYKMRSMIFLWAQYLKISKTASPSTDTGVKELQAIARDWKNPLFHWMAKQAFDELKAISEVEWPEHKQQYGELKSTEPTS